MKSVTAVVLAAMIFATSLFAQNVPPKINRGEILNKKSKIDKTEKIETVKLVCPVIKDTWVYAFRPDSCYGNGLGWKDRTNPDKDLTVPKMFLGFGGTDKKAVLLQFDVTKLPKGKIPVKAVVRLYNDFAGSDAATKVDMKMVLAAWDEMKVNWKNKPAWTSVVISTCPLTGSIGYGQAGKWYEWDATKLVDVWVNKNKPNYGLVLDPQGESGVDRDFVCKEYKGREQFFPVLEVTYKKQDLKNVTPANDSLKTKKKIDTPIQK